MKVMFVSLRPVAPLLAVMDYALWCVLILSL
jgi:hypothetical protein